MIDQSELKKNINPMRLSIFSDLLNKTLRFDAYYSAPLYFENQYVRKTIRK